MTTDSDYPAHVQYEDESTTDYYAVPTPCSPGFKVSGIYATRYGRQDMAFVAPEQAQHIRKVHRDPVKDMDWYRVYHGRNLEHLQEIQQQQTTLKREQIEAEQKHQELLDKIRRQSERKRNIVRNRSKSLSDIKIQEPSPNQTDVAQSNVTTTNIPKAPETSHADRGVNIELQSKPKWSLTEAENEMVIDNEVDDLLDFVDSLQIDDFLENLEMQQKLEMCRKRIENLENKGKELNAQVVQIEEAVEAAMIEEQCTQNGGALDEENIFADNSKSNTKVPVQAGEIGTTQSDTSSKDETDQIAADLLQGSTKMRNIHSKQSIRSIISTKLSKSNPWSDVATRKLNEIMKRQDYQQTSVDGPDNEPRQSTACERLPPLKIRQKLNGSDINNLPYLFRHPGV